MSLNINPILFTDTGNAELLVALHGNDFRYLSETSEFYVFNGRYWKPDKNNSTLFRLSKDVIDEFRNPNPDIADSDEFDPLEAIQWAIKTASKARRSSMIYLARHEEGITESIKSFDRDPYQLNLKNGTLNLKTSELRDHRREDFITKIVPVEYDPNATCTQFLNFLTQIIPNEETLRFLQRALGYSLTGLTKEHVLFILYGSGRNGKSTLLNLVRNILNTYAKDTDPETFFNKNHSPTRNDLARLVGSRFVTSTEGEEGKSLSESLVKKITGGDPLVARFLFREFFQFVPEFKIFLATNHKPKIRGTDHAIWSRIKLIPFNVVIPETEINQDLQEQLRKEAPGVLNWLVQGCREWQEHGLGNAAEITEATQHYREDMDTISSFIKQKYTEDKTARVSFAAIYSNYENWCTSNGERPESKKKFSSMLKEKGIQSGRDSKSRYVQGIKTNGISNSGLSE